MMAQNAWSSYQNIIVVMRKVSFQNFLIEKSIIIYFGDTAAAAENKMADLRHFQIW